jgi:hypothetical protein
VGRDPLVLNFFSFISQVYKYQNHGLFQLDSSQIMSTLESGVSQMKVKVNVFKTHLLDTK